MYCLLRMELAAYLQENAILSLSQGGAFEPFFKPNPGVSLYEQPNATVGHLQLFQNKMTNTRQMPRENRHTWN